MPPRSGKKKGVICRTFKLTVFPSISLWHVLNLFGSRVVQKASSVRFFLRPQVQKRFSVFHLQFSSQARPPFVNRHCRRNVVRQRKIVLRLQARSKSRGVADSPDFR